MGFAGIAVALLAASGSAPAFAQETSADGERALYEAATALADLPGRDFSALALEALARYDRRYPEGRYLDDVHYRMARHERERGRSVASASRLLEVVLVDRDGLRAPAAREELEALLSRDRAVKPHAPRFREAMQRYGEGSSLPPRLAFLRALALLALPESDAIAALEAELHLERSPAGADSAEVALLLGDIEQRRDEPRRAIAAWLRVDLARPGGALSNPARLRVGESLSRNLGLHAEAITTLEALARGAEHAPEAATAWRQMGDIERKGLGRPRIAVRNFDEVLTRYPDHPEAFAALLAKSDTLARDLRDPEGAERVLLEGVERYPDHVRAPEALERAAVLQESELSAPARAADNYERLAGRYPAYEGSPAGLYRAAELRERAGERKRAAHLYGEVLRRWPGHKLAERAGRRQRKLEESGS